MVSQVVRRDQRTRLAVFKLRKPELELCDVAGTAHRGNRHCLLPVFACRLGLVIGGFPAAGPGRFERLLEVIGGDAKEDWILGPERLIRPRPKGLHG